MLRFVLITAILAIAGCNRTVVERESVTSPDGKSRLLLRYNTSDHKGFDFNDLLLQTLSESVWANDSIVWTGDADVSPGVTRWVSSLHSLNNDRQSAVIQIATMGPPDAGGNSTVEYSWVRWDLASNTLLKTLLVCDSPFDKLPPEMR